MKYSLKIETGTFVGTGAAQHIQPVCDGPSWVLTKRIDGTPTVSYTMWDRMPVNKANSFGGTFAEKATQLMELTKDGFYVGAGQSQSAAKYAYVAIKALSGCPVFQTGRYYGDGTDNRQLRNIGGNQQGTSFLPDLVGLHIALDGNLGRWRSSQHVGDLSNSYTVSPSANGIQNFLADGFEVGTSSNTASQYFNWFAMKNFGRAIKIGSFTGTGVRQEIDIGYRPTAVFCQNYSVSQNMIMLTQGMVDLAIGGISVSAIAPDITTIETLTNKGFIVGDSAICNGVGNKVVYWAFTDGEYSPYITKTTV